MLILACLTGVVDLVVYICINGFNHPVVRCQILTSHTLLCCSHSLLLLPCSPSPRAVFVYRNKPCVAVAALHTASWAQKVLVSSCSQCDMVNCTLQIRHIGYRSAVALLSPIVQVTADMPISDVRYRYLSDTNH